MAENNQGNRTSTSTQIRNMYSDGMSYMNIKFFNTNLSFCLYPFISKDDVGRSTYDMKNGQQTTVNFEGAYALYQTSKDIISGKLQEINLPVPCLAGATLTLERKLGQNGKLETIFSITKNNVNIPFRFHTIEQQLKENGQIVTKVVEAGLGAFMKTLDGYLTGINADRHLDKLTEDFAKIQQNQQGGQPQQGGNYNGGYRSSNGGGYKKPPYQGGSGYKKPYNGGGYNNGQQNNGSWNNNNNAPATAQQPMSSYNVQN